MFDFGTGPRNLALFNPQGTLLMLAGFGNLRGGIEMWDVANKKEVSKFEAPDSTDVKWSPDGQLIVTSTCAPRYGTFEPFSNVPFYPRTGRENIKHAGIYQTPLSTLKTTFKLII